MAHIYNNILAGNSTLRAGNSGRCEAQKKKMVLFLIGSGAVHLIRTVHLKKSGPTRYWVGGTVHLTCTVYLRESEPENAPDEQ